jgi:hypothetical protein
MAAIKHHMFLKITSQGSQENTVCLITLWSFLHTYSHFIIHNGSQGIQHYINPYHIYLNTRQGLPLKKLQLKNNRNFFPSGTTTNPPPPPQIKTSVIATGRMLLFFKWNFIIWYNGMPAMKIVPYIWYVNKWRHLEFVYKASNSTLESQNSHKCSRKR